MDLEIGPTLKFHLSWLHASASCAALVMVSLVPIEKPAFLNEHSLKNYQPNVTKIGRGDYCYVEI